MMKLRIFLSAAIIIAAFSLKAQESKDADLDFYMLKSGGVNLSLWKGVSTQPTNDFQFTWLNIGLQSTMNKLKGLSVNVVASTVRKDMVGVQLSGLANIAGNRMNGLQVSGLTNVTGDNMLGLSASGLVNIAGNQARGMLVSGIMNITGDKSKGVFVSGGVNLTGEEASGIQVAGISNITGADMTGIIVSGLLSVTGDSMKGLQISGLGNLTGETANGIQISPLNYATNVKGLQVGLINYYKDKMDGFQLGLVNLNPDTRVQYMFFGGNETKLNVGVRFKNKLFYTILGGGTHYFDFNDKFSAALFHRGGIAIPLCKRLSLSGDLGYQHIETFKNKDKSKNIPGRLYALQGRVNLEYELTDKLGIFATGGYGYTRYYNKSKNFDKGVIAEAGIVIR